MATREQLRRNMTATKWIVKYIYRTAKYAGEPVSILEVNNDVNDILNGKEVTRENLGKFQGEFSFLPTDLNISITKMVCIMVCWSALLRLLANYK